MKIVIIHENATEKCELELGRNGFYIRGKNTDGYPEIEIHDCRKEDDTHIDIHDCRKEDDTRSEDKKPCYFCSGYSKNEDDAKESFWDVYIRNFNKAMYGEGYDCFGCSGCKNKNQCNDLMNMRVVDFFTLIFAK